MENKKVRPKMPVAQRAKQFMPFAAVAGLDRAIKMKEIEMDVDGGRKIRLEDLESDSLTEEDILEILAAVEDA